jgi:Phosphotransferase enzyme family
MPGEAEVPLSGGNLSATVRVGDTVRRATGPWTPAVHALLRHLETLGFDGSSRALGFDDKGREILTYIEGEAGSMMPQPAYMWTDDALVAAARLARRYHDAIEGFVPPPDARWRAQVGAPDDDGIICHNDLAPWNTIFLDAEPYALIDWDFAAPGSRLWDVAYAVWRWVPVYPDWKCRIVGADEATDFGRRARLFCDAYGLDVEDRAGLLDTMHGRMQVLSDTIRSWGEAGEAGFAELLRMGYDKLPLQDMEVLEAHREEIERALA